MRIAVAAALVLCAVVASASSQPAQTLEARFVGNMAYAISDGTTTLFTDFPYQSGYSRYMTYERQEIRSRTERTLALITHRHRDHWEPILFRATGWSVVAPSDAIPNTDPRRVVKALPVPASRQTVTFEGISIDALPTEHAGVGHYSYLVTWHGQRLYFTGDTEDTAALVDAKNLDVAFVSPWLFQRVLKSGQRLDARRVVIYHQEAGQTSVEGCSGTCSVPRQGEIVRLSR
jgi:L-ascorbate metabolism protein UlaG (beta-lactamase superfamily)